MDKTIKVKMPKVILDTFKEYQEKLDNNTKPFLNKGSIKEIYKLLGLPEDCNVDINDFLQFSQYFGKDYKLYQTYKPLEDSADVSWEDISNIKYGDIDFKEGFIYFKGKVKAYEK